MQFDSDTVNCIAVFPGTGSQRQGTQPLFFTALGTLDYPAARVQVRYTDPHNAFAVAEAVRVWMEANLPNGYLTCRAEDSIAKDATDEKSLGMSGGPAYIFEVVFNLTKVRA